MANRCVDLMEVREIVWNIPLQKVLLLNNMLYFVFQLV